MSRNKKSSGIKLELSDDLKKLLYEYYKSAQPGFKANNATENLVIDFHSSLLEKLLRGNGSQYVQPNDLRIFRYLNGTTTAENLNSTTAVDLAKADSDGAAMYVVVVIIWYFFGVVAFVAWQMKKKKTPSDYKSQLLSQGLEDQVKTKQILGNGPFKFSTRTAKFGVILILFCL